MRRLVRPSSRARGFTLVELMVVVTIVGILSMIGVASFRKRIFGSRPAEALAMIQSIRAAEERWKADNLTYLNVTRTSNWYPVKPSGPTKHTFYNAGTCGIPLPDSDDCRWKLLNPTIIGATQFGFMVTAGSPGTAMTEPDKDALPAGWTTWSPSADHWYVIQAIADADANNIYSKFVASSIRGDVYHENDGE